MSQSSAYKEIHNVFIIAYIVNKGALIQFCFFVIFTYANRKSDKDLTHCFCIQRIAPTDMQLEAELRQKFDLSSCLRTC